MKKTLLALTLLPFMSFAMTLDEMVSETINTNPIINISIEKQNAAQSRLDQENAEFFLPKLDFNGNGGFEQVSSPATDANSSYEPGAKYDANFILKENLFKGFDTQEGIRSREAGFTSSHYQLIEKANDLSLEATKAYLNVLKTKELLEVAKDNVEVHSTILNKISKKVNAGTKRQSLYDQTLSRLENAKSDVIFAEQEHANAKVKYRRVLDDGVDFDTLVKPQDGTLNYANLEEAVDAANEYNPTLLADKYDIEEADANYARVAAKYYPTLDLQGEARLRNNVHGISGQDNSFAALAVVSYNLYNGGADQAKREENMHIMLEKKYSLADAQRYIKERLSKAWNTYTYTETQLEHIELNIKAAKKTVEDYHKEYNLGRRSLVDLLNSELELNSAKNRAVNVSYTRMSAYYEILAHSGTLLDAFNIELDVEND